MIISCPNCSKKFNISEALIPKNGRLLQCSNCNHKWHYQIPIEEINNIEPIKLSDSEEHTNEVNIDLKQIKKKKSAKKIKAIKKKSSQKDKETYLKNENKNNITSEKHISLFNSFLIITITLIAIVIVIDTFKLQISYYFPIINVMLDNLYNIFFDINSFIKDLIK